MKQYFFCFRLGILVFCLLVSMNTAIFAMKRTADEISTTEKESALMTLPLNLLWQSMPSRCNARLVGVCKYFLALFKVNNYKTILRNNPAMIMDSPTDSGRIYYRVIQANDLDTMKRMLSADTHAAQSIGKILKESSRSFFSSEMKELIESHCNELFNMTDVSDKSAEWDKFIKFVIGNDILGMKEYLKTKDNKALRKEIISMGDSEGLIAQYATIAMLEKGFGPVLTEMVLSDEEIERPLQDILVAQAGKKERGYRVSIVEYLVSNKADVMAYDNNNDSVLVAALQLAHEKKDYALLDLYIRSGGNVNPAENQDRNIEHKETGALLPTLIWAIWHGDVALVHLLLCAGACTKATANLKEWDALEEAKKIGNEEIIRAITYKNSTLPR